ncbi:MAG: DedA family protein [Candidatus Moraniibacteriota bacterium]
MDLVDLLQHYRYLILLPVAAVEGPTVTIIAGFLVSLGVLHFWAALVTVILADICGSTFLYLVGRSGRKFSDSWLFRRLGATEERLRRLEEHFFDHAGLSLVIGKISHAVGSVALLAAGAARYPYPRFLAYNALAQVPLATILLILGYYFGETYQQLDRYFEYTAFGVVALVVFALFAAAVLRKFRIPRPF